MSYIELLVENSIRYTPGTYQDVLVLKEKNGNRCLPLWIARTEYASISVILQNMKVTRPLTHDLLVNLLELTECKVLSAFISELRDDTYYSYLIITLKNAKHSLDCRASDAVAVALRLKVPIFTTEEIMSKAGTILDHEGSIDSTKESMGNATLPENEAAFEVKCIKCGVAQFPLPSPYGIVCLNCGSELLPPF